MTVVFYSDVSWTYSGFSATYTAQNTAQHPCPQEYLTAPSGSISSPLYSSAETVHCSWLIEVAADHIVLLSFTSFSVGNCKVVVYDGSSSLDRIIGRFDGSSIPANRVSTSNQMLVTFLPDVNDQSVQFTADYSTTTVNGNITLDIL
ncbi:exoskeleton protein RP43-like [Argopecten irradians]|uniref:exoskeleton protein RP43-like n=1 Tax=Argopecten irradians TaxID=31199 RepID=UPI003723C73A